MRHRKTTPKLGRSPSHRKAMLRNMVTDLLRHERVRTTQAKAKAVRKVAEKMITLGKRETLGARRKAARVIRDKEVVRKLFDDLAPRYMERPGGYTRVLKLPTRSGDRAEMAIVELVEAEMEVKEKPSKPEKLGVRTAAADTAAKAGKAKESEGQEAAAEETAEATDDEAVEAAAEESTGADETAGSEEASAEDEDEEDKE